MISFHANANVYVKEFNDSKDLYIAKKYNASITKLNNLIQSGNLDEETLTRAFLYRGLSNYEMENFISAITDITNALWLDLLSSEERDIALDTRSSARAKIGQVDLANQDKNYKDSLSVTKKNENDEQIKSVNVEDLTVERKIDNIRSNFSMNISNFFGQSDIEILEKPKDNNYVMDDKDIYEKILKFNVKDDTDGNPIKEESVNIKEVEPIINNTYTINPEPIIAEDTDVIVDDVSEEVINNISNWSYIEMASGLTILEAKIRVNKIINDNYKVLSGIQPQTREVSDSKGISTYDIFIGPFSNMNRLQDIVNSLEKNNYQYNIKNIVG
jgi:hypothetical protein